MSRLRIVFHLPNMQQLIPFFPIRDRFTYYQFRISFTYLGISCRVTDLALHFFLKLVN